MPAPPGTASGPDPADVVWLGRRGAGGGDKVEGQPMTAVQDRYNEIKDSPSALLAYAITGLDSGSRRDDALQALDKVCEALKEWKFLGGTPADMQAKVEDAYKSLRNPIDVIDQWTKKLPDVKTHMDEVPQDPGYNLDDAETEALELARKFNQLNNDMTQARAEINEAKEAIGQIWQTVTGVTSTLAKAIESEVKNAVARVHSEGIEVVGSITTIGGRILDLIGIIDPTLLGELGLKAVKVAVEGLAEGAKMAVEQYSASQMTIDQALEKYSEWDIAIASAERWKGGVKVAIHTASMAIPKYGLVSPIVDGLVEVWFDTPINKGKALQVKAKEKADKGEKLEGVTDPGDFWGKFKEEVYGQFKIDNATEASDRLFQAFNSEVTVAVAENAGEAFGEVAQDVASEIIGKLFTAVASVLAEQFLPVEPAQAIPPLDIKTRLGDLRGVYTNSLQREMDPGLKTEFENAMSNL
jgi:uncharacterized protein YoxC